MNPPASRRRPTSVGSSSASRSAHRSRLCGAHIPYLLSRPLAIISLPPAEALEADREHSGSEEALRDAEQTLPPDQEPAIIAQPGEASLHCVPLPILLFARHH